MWPKGVPYKPSLQSPTAFSKRSVSRECTVAWELCGGCARHGSVLLRLLPPRDTEKAVCRTATGSSTKNKREWETGLKSSASLSCVHSLLNNYRIPAAHTARDWENRENRRILALLDLYIMISK